MSDPGALLRQLTLDEKASLVSGQDFWRTEEVARVGIKPVMVTDGPHGLRKQRSEPDQLGLDESVPATCFPTAAALGSTWDEALVRRVGEALGVEARAEGVSVLLGPGLNIKRSPLCGRNFEYVSEDPVLSGRIGAALVGGIQAQGVGTSLKHFAANNQETDRMRVSVEVDERTLREIYLPAFEHVIRTAQPWTVMCSYNRINGVRASENAWLLTTVLREEWGFTGLVVSDWGAVWDPVAALAAGLDLEMPGTGGRSASAIAAAVRAGTLAEADLERSATRVLALSERSLEALANPGEADFAAHHALAREAAAAGSVLLTNDAIDGAPLLPLEPGARVAVIGEFARTPRYQGAGSSQVSPTRLDDLLSALADRLETDVPFAPGFTVATLGDATGDPQRDVVLREEAVDLARDADVVVVCLGLPAPDESEGYDRRHTDLPANQIATLEAVAAVNSRVVVVLANGSVVTMPWRDRVPALLEVWLGGQAAGSATADVLLGVAEPGGRLAETIPRRHQDNPSFGNFPGEPGHPGTVRYGEGVLVGYRWYDAREIDVAFPFGHGLGYTTFSYDALVASVTGRGDEATVHLRVTVTNTGTRRGAEVVQVYVGDPDATVVRPVRELKAFAKVTLDPRESRELTFQLVPRDLSYWHPALRRWVVEGGEFTIEVGASSRDIRQATVVEVAGEALIGPCTAESTLAEWQAHPVGGPMIVELIAEAPALDLVMLAMIQEMPVRVIASFGIAGLDPERLDALVRAVDAADGGARHG